MSCRLCPVFQFLWASYKRRDYLKMLELAFELWIMRARSMLNVRMTSSPTKKRGVPNSLLAFGMLKHAAACYSHCPFKNRTTEASISSTSVSWWCKETYSTVSDDISTCWNTDSEAPGWARPRWQQRSGSYDWKVQFIQSEIEHLCRSVTFAICCREAAQRMPFICKLLLNCRLYIT